MSTGTESQSMKNIAEYGERRSVVNNFLEINLAALFILSGSLYTFNNLGVY